MVLQLIDKLKKSEGVNSDCKLYNELVNAGIIPISINCWLEMYNYFNIRMTVNAEFKDCKARSYTETSEQFAVSEMTIRRAVKYINK
jgi:hypothetical protein